MKIKRLLCYIISMVLIIAITSSFNVFAKDSNYYYLDLPDTRIVSTDSSTFTLFEINSISEGARQFINDSISNNNGCKVIVYVSYNQIFNTFDTAPQMIMYVNHSCISTFNQSVYLNGNTAIFDFDTVMSKANWDINQRNGLIRDITFGVNANVTIKAIEIQVPKLQELAAGAPCKEYILSL